MKTLIWNGLNKRKMIRKPRPPKETIEKLNNLDKYDKICKILTSNIILNSKKYNSIYVTTPNNHSVKMHEILKDGTVKEIHLGSDVMSASEAYQKLSYYSGLPNDNVYEIWNVKTHENKKTIMMHSDVYDKMINVYRRYAALDSVWRDIIDIIKK